MPQSFPDLTQFEGMKSFFCFSPDSHYSFLGWYFQRKEWFSWKSSHTEHICMCCLPALSEVSHWTQLQHPWTFSSQVPISLLILLLSSLSIFFHHSDSKDEHITLNKKRKETNKQNQPVLGKKIHNLSNSDCTQTNQVKAKLANHVLY